MKKLISLLLVLVMVGMLAACGGNDNNGTTSGNNDTTVNDTTANDTTVNDTTSGNTASSSAVDVLTGIWNAHGEDERFFAMGGSASAPVDGAPGAVDATDADTLRANLILPAELHASIDDAASLMHAMNANTFTTCVFHLVTGTDVDTFTKTLRDAVQGNQWMCGFPEELFITVIDGEYVLLAFGAADLLDVYTGHVAEVYPNAVTAYDEPMA